MMAALTTVSIVEVVGNAQTGHEESTSRKRKLSLLPNDTDKSSKTRTEN